MLDQPTYFDWGVLNQGTAPAQSQYYVDLYVDNIRHIRYPFLPGVISASFIDWQITINDPGNHIVKIVVDADNNAAESNEINNTWERQFYWEGASACTVPSGQYCAEYYNNTNLSGSPSFTRNESAPVNYDWSSQSPGVPGIGDSNYSVRWQGRFTFEAAEYKFIARSDDGIRVWLDGTQLPEITDWTDHGPVDYVAIRTLTAGEHEIKVEYYQAFVWAVIQFRWEKVDVTPVPTVASVTPNNGPAAGGTGVTIAGTGFVAEAKVTFGGAAATILTLTATSITATTPTHAAGAVSVVVTNPDTKSATLTNGFTFNSVNLLLIPSFEIATNGKPDSWSTNSKFTRSNAIQPYHGTYVGKFYATDNSGVTITQTVNVSAGTTYSFSCHANMPATADAFTFKFQVQWLKANNAVISTKTIKTYTDDTAGAWNQATGTLVAPAGAGKAKIMMVVTSLKGTIYVDNCVFKPA